MYANSAIFILESGTGPEKRPLGERMVLVVRSHPSKAWTGHPFSCAVGLREEQPQILRLCLAGKYGQTALRMTKHLMNLRRLGFAAEDGKIFGW
jgi:hypothetical protein